MSLEQFITLKVEAVEKLDSLLTFINDTEILSDEEREKNSKLIKEISVRVEKLMKQTLIDIGDWVLLEDLELDKVPEDDNKIIDFELYRKLRDKGL